MAGLEGFLGPLPLLAYQVAQGLAGLGFDTHDDGFTARRVWRRRVKKLKQSGSA
jgi:hypothetical protein